MGMLKVLWVVWVLLFAVGSAGATEVREDASLQEFFREAGYEGCFAVLDPEAETVIVSNRALASRALLPASTFKIPHTLIALDTGVHAGMDSMLPWDGRDRGYAPWNRDLTLTEAFRVSAIWYYQETARRIGPERMAASVNKLAYGNADISGPLDAFWLEGGLRVSALQQVDFLRRFDEKRLPVAAEHIQAVRQALLLEKNDRYAFYAKTGWAQRVTPQIG